MNDVPISISKSMSYISELSGENNTILCVGKNVISEEKFIGNNSIYYIPKEDFDVFSFAIGIAISDERRVLIILEDYYVLKYLSSLTQLSMSSCKNIIIFILNTNKYSYNITQRTLSKSIRSMYNVLFNIGFFMYNYTPYFRNKVDLKKVESLYINTAGPAIIYVDIDSSLMKGDMERYRNITSIRDILKNGLYNTKE